MTQSIPTIDSRCWSRYRLPRTDARTAFVPGVLDRRAHQPIDPSAVRTAPPVLRTSGEVVLPGATAAVPPAGGVSPVPAAALEPPDKAARGYGTQNLVVIADDRSNSLDEYRLVSAQSLREVADTLKSDLVSAYALQVAQVQFAADRVESTAFLTAADWNPRDLLPWGGNTPLGRAVATSLALVRRKAEDLRRAGQPVGRTILAVQTDGGATDVEEWDRVLPEVHRAEREERLLVYPVGIGRVVPALARLSCKRPPALVAPEAVAGFYRWLADVLLMVSRSRPSDGLDLPPSDGWRTM